MNLPTLLNEFNIILNTPEGLTELRSLILGLAVRGKLVPQDPNDEPASELLKKIEAEKERLFEEEKIRKPKDIPAIPDEKIPFDIPNNWIWARNGNLILFQNGYAFKSGQFQESGIGVIRIGDLQNGEVVEDSMKYISKEYASEVKDDYLIKQGDMLIAMSGATTGKLAINNSGTTYLLNQRVGKIDPIFVNQDYLYRYLNTKIEENLAKSSGSAIPNLSTKQIGELEIPLPPLAEQHRIVQKIESLFAEVDELEAKLNRQAKLDEKLQVAVNAEVQQAPDAEASKSAWSFITSNFDTLYHTPEAIDNLKKNILNEAVRGRLVPQNPNDEPASELLNKIEAEKQRLYEEGEIRKPKKLPPVKVDEIPFEIPESWEWVRLAKVSNVEMGQSPPGSTYNKEGDGVHLINGPVEFGKGPLARTKVVQYSTKPKKFCKEGDLLLCVRGSTLGRTNIAGFDACIGRGVAAIQPYFGGIYLHYYIVSERKNIYDFGTGSTFPSINKGNIENYIFPLPPLEEQHRIVQRIEELFAICDRFKAQLEQREKVNEKLVKGLVQEVLAKASSSEKE